MLKITKAIILAGGQGKRMGGNIPKVLHPVQGIPMIHHIIKNLNIHGIKDIIIVVGENREKINNALAGDMAEGIRLVDQIPPRGTGDAVAQCLPLIHENDKVLIVNGDTPLLKHAITYLSVVDTSVLLADVDDPFGQGRVILNEDGSFKEIVEEKDATPEQRLVKRVNAGVYFLNGKDLLSYIPLLDTNNAQGEYYLTDVLKFIKDRVNLCVLPKEYIHEIINVNTPKDLENAERVLRNCGISPVFKSC